jgi:uncharacterized protein
MKFYRINTELFVIPIGCKYIVYSPCRGAMLTMNAAGINVMKSLDGQKIGIDQHKEFIQQLIEVGIVTEQDKFVGVKANVDQAVTGCSRPEVSPTSTTEFLPMDVTILPTYDCNLRCVYCYSSGGERKTVIDVRIATAAIDYCAQNAARSERRTLEIMFHGGGEPTIGWDILTKSVTYARSLAQKWDLSLRTGIVTNGVFNDSKRKWIGRNISSIAISLDGPENVQNQQRPLANGAGTFHRVQRTLAGFDKDNVKYWVRSTVTKASVHTMGEFVRRMAKYRGLMGINFEPLVFNRRCRETKVQKADPKAFIKMFREAREIGNKLGIDVQYSGASLRLPPIRRFCGASRPNFIITPEGYVTSCPEVTDTAHPYSETFIYGQYDKQRKGYLFDNSKIRHLQSLTSENRQYCKDCFLKWHCSGGCPLRAIESSKSYSKSSGTETCLINWELSKDQLLTLVTDNKLGAGDKVDMCML